MTRYLVPGSLIAVAAIWGTTFVVVADAISAYPMYAFLAWRFGVATVAFVLFFPGTLKKLDAPNLRRGFVAGLLLTAGYVFQTWGLVPAAQGGTTPARAAFLTGMYVIIVPLIQAVWLRSLPRKATLGGAALAFGGLWLLSGIGGASGQWVLGDSLVLICAFAYSLHMLALGSTDDRHDTLALTLVQLATVTIVTAAVSLVREDAGLPSQPRVMFAIVVCGVLASTLAFVIQTWAQRRMQPSRVALILVTEPAFGGLFGWWIAGAWPIREVIGAVLMLGGMIVSEVVAGVAGPEEHIEFEPAMEGMPAPVIEDPDGARHG